MESKFLEPTQSQFQSILKPSRKRFQTISYMFNLNVKQALANQIFCILYIDYMCIIALNDRKCQNASICLFQNGTESNNTFSYILLGHFSVCQEDFFCREQAYQSLSYVGKGVNFQLCPPLGPPGIFTAPNWYMHNFAMGPTI